MRAHEYIQKLIRKISYALPACHPLVGIPSEPGHGNHTPGFTACTKTVEAHGATLQASVAMAVIGAKVLREEDYARKVSPEPAHLLIPGPGYLERHH